jgi:hypothetical protein
MTTRDEFQAMEHKAKKGTEYKHPMPKERKPEGEDKKKKPTKKDYVDAVVRESVKDNPKRSLYDLSEIGRLAEEQWADDTNIIKQEVFSVR